MDGCRATLTALVVLVALGCSDRNADASADDADGESAILSSESEGSGSAGLGSEVGSDSELGSALQTGSPGEVDLAAEWSVAGVLQLALAPNAECVDAPSGEPLRIGYAADFSLTPSASAAAGGVAVRYLAGLINCFGGVGGKRVEVLSADVGGTPLVARQATLDLLAWEPDAIIGPGSSESGLRLLEATGGEVPVLFPTSTQPALADATRSSFLISPDAGSVGAGVADFAQEQGWSTAATFSSNGPDFNSAALAFGTEFESGGGTVSGRYESADGQAAGSLFDVDALASDPPDVIFAALASSQSADLLSALRSAEVGSAVVLSGPLGLGAISGSVGGGVAGPADDLLDGVFVMSPVPMGAGGSVEQLLVGYLAESGTSFADDHAAVLSADALVVVVEAFLASDDGSTDQIGATIAGGITVEAVGGRVRLAGSATSDRTLFVQRFVDGEPTQVATIEP